MKKHFLEGTVEGKPEFRAEPWYNPHGDCIVYQTANEEVVADRIDGILTIYRSAVDNRPIGYQIKGVFSLIKKFGWDGVSFESEERDGRITRVSIAALLLAAYEDGPKTLRRRSAYASIMEPRQAHGISKDELVPA